MSNGPTDRIAGTGMLTFALKNDDGTYSPGHTNVQSGFAIGNKVRLSFVFEGETWYKYYGRIAPNGIKVIPGTKGHRYTLITAHDWMGQINNHELRLLTMETLKRTDEALALIDANLEISPLSTDYGTGITFTRIFHDVGERTKAVAEISKLVDSEMGQYYVVGDRSGGETVKLDTRYVRATLGSPTQLTLTNSEAGRLLKEDGEYLLKEDGDKIVLSQTQSAEFDNTMFGMEVSQGKHLANIIKSRAQQVTIDDAATTILFSIEKIIEVSGNSSLLNLRSPYIDPSGGGRKVRGTEMVTPVATTDYTANAEEGGGGADYTANLSITNPDGTGNVSFGAEAAEYGLVNNGSQKLYVTKLQFRGMGIYDYQAVDYVAEDETSSALHGARPLTITFIYEDDPTVAKSYGEILLSELANEGTTVDYFEINANRNSMTLYAFLQLEPGTRFSLVEDQAAIGDDYFVNGYDAEIIDGKFVNWKIIPRSAGGQSFWILGTSALGVDTGLGIG